MPSVVIGMESDQIAVEDSEEDLVPHREDTIYFAAREWCVQEKADLYVCFGVAYFFP